MKCLVTGAAGFIGSTLTEELLARGEEVIAVDVLTDYYDIAQKEANLASYAGTSGCEFLRADLTSREVLDRLGEVDVVYHLAGQPGVRLSWDSYFAVYVQQNVTATQALLEAVKAAGVPRLVYASSSSAYGNQPSYPVEETAVPQPFSPYGVTKLAGEHLCHLYATNYGTSTVALRYFTVYGPRQRPDMAFSKFIRNGLRGEPIRITGDGTAVRDFTFVGDIVAATMAAGCADVAPGSLYNACGKESATVNEAVDLISGALGFDLEVERTGVAAGDVTQTGGVSELAERELGWTAQTSLADGITQQVAWERSRR